MGKKEKAKLIAEKMREHNDRYGFPTKPKKSNSKKKNE